MNDGRPPSSTSSDGNRNDRPTTDGLFLGADLEISPPPVLPPLARPATPAARPATPAAGAPGRPPSRQLQAARGSSLRPPLRNDLSPARDDTTRIVGIIAVAVAVIGILVVVFLRSGAARGVRPPAAAPVATATTTAVEAPTPPATAQPGDSAIRPVAPPRSATAGAIRNLVTNPSFEQVGADGKPVGWETQHYQGEAQFSVAVGAGRRGGNAACITSATGGDVAWFTKVAVKPGATYLVKGWVRCENLAGGRGGQLNMPPAEVRSDAITGTTPWKQLQFTFDSADLGEVQINCLYGGWGQATGTVWFDDIEVTELFSGH